MSTNNTNKNITFRGKPLTVQGAESKVGQAAPALKLTDLDLDDLTWAKYDGRWVILSVVPSLDTSTCAIQTKRFNEELSRRNDKLAVLTVSLDLPFAQKRWLETENCLRTEAASDYKYREFGQDYGVYIAEMGLLTRAIFVIDPARIVKHVEYVPNISDEPDYLAALSAVR